MLKFAGILLLMAGCAGLGIDKVSEEKRRINELREIRGIIIRMQNEMVYGKRTLPEICLLFGECAKEPYRSAFSAIFESFNENDGRALYMLWEEKMAQCMKDLPLKEEEKDILKNLPGHLGILDETIQAVDVGQSLDIITRHITSAQEAYENKAKVIMSVSIMTGLFLIILLL